MKILRTFFVLIVMMLFVLGGIIFKRSTPTECGEILPDDSIFVLTGDARRIPFAVKLMEKYPDTDLYIIGAGATTMTDVSATIESESQSTYQNATAIRQIVTSAGLDRIVLVTTEDHILRARHLIKSELPDIEIVVCPVRLTGTPAVKRLERWGTEYVKYIVTMLGIKES